MLMHNGVRTRVGFRVEDGKKVRFAKKTGDVIDTVIDKKKVRESK